MQIELGEKFDSCNVLNLARRVQMIWLQTQSNKEYQLKESYPYKGAENKRKNKRSQVRTHSRQSLKKVFQIT